MKASGIITFVIGLLMTMYTGVTIANREKIVDLGKIELRVQNQRTINWEPYVGIGAMIVGGVVFVLGRKRSLALVGQ